MSCTKIRLPLLLIRLAVTLPLVCAQGMQNSFCALHILAPFTIDGSTILTYDEKGNSSTPGLHHMSAALLAMLHFNQRNTTVVKELSKFEDCTIFFKDSQVFDSEAVGHGAIQTVFDAGALNPCAIAGPFYDDPGLDFTALATASQFPLVAHRGFNMRSVSTFHSPYNSQVFPETLGSAITFIEFLREKNRTNYTSVLYSTSDAGLQRLEALKLALESYKMSSTAHPYSLLPPEISQFVKPRDIPSVLRELKSVGFRTIVVAMEDAEGELPVIADAAVALDMVNGDYFWTFFQEFELAQLTASNTNITHLLSGAAWISPFEESLLDYNSPFQVSWRSVDQDFVNWVNEMNPIPESDAAYVKAELETFQRDEISFGSGFMYDAVMSIGMGACLANQTGGFKHVEGVREAAFAGASGYVKIGSDTDWPHARYQRSVTWGAFNLLPHEEEKAPLTDVHHVGAENWTPVIPFIFADGRTVAPDLLRREPDSHFLNPVLRGFGLGMMSLAIFLAIVSAIWVFVRRNHFVLRAAQPYFMYLISFGSVVTAFAILPGSFDESYGWDQDRLSRACMSIPWLLCMGHIVTYGALFAKLWRVFRVMGFHQQPIEYRQVVWPPIALGILAILMLSLWTGLDGLFWERELLNETTGETFGRCTCDSRCWAFFGPLICIMMTATFLAGFMAYKTRNVADDYSESWWIWILVMIQFEEVLVALPIVVILADLSKNGQYFAFTTMIWILPMSNLAILVVPKVVHFVNFGKERRPRRGESPGIRVTGLNAATNNHHDQRTLLSTRNEASVST